MSASSTRLQWSPDRAFAIAGNTFREAVRMKLFLAMTAMAICSLASAFFFRDFNFGSSELKFIADFGFGGMSVFGSALAVIVSAQLFCGEIEHRTVLTVLAKPIHRSEFVVGKFLGAWSTAICFLAMLTLCLIAALWWRETSIMAESPDAFESGRIVPYGSVLGFALAQVFRVGILCAVVILFSTYATSSLFAMVMGVLIWIVGQLQPIATEAWGTVDNWALKGIYAFVSYALPNLRLFDIGDPTALGETLPVALYGKLAIYATLYATFYLAIASASFNRREL